VGGYRLRTRIIPAPVSGFEIDDVRIIPRIESVHYRDVDISARISKKRKMRVPFLPSPMDCVIDYEMAKKVIGIGSVPFIFINRRNPNEGIAILECLRNEFDGDVSLGACIPPDIDFIKSNLSLIESSDILALDTLHSMPYKHLETIAYLKKKHKNVEIVSGNVTNGFDARRLVDTGVDCIRVGMTSNSINKGSDMFGCGRKQGSAIFECAQELERTGIPIIADGGIAEPKDIVLALALGADCVMMGKMFAAMEESPCPIVEIDGEKYKRYRGMSRIGVIDEGMIPESDLLDIKLSGNFESQVAIWMEVVKIAVARSGVRSIKGLRSNCLLELRQ
jgi:IMP dehydrogenase/GMP reductase